jgi:hypothetical protein
MNRAILDRLKEVGLIRVLDEFEYAMGVLSHQVINDPIALEHARQKERMVQLLRADVHRYIRNVEQR